jgi:hypothetical protein
VKARSSHLRCWGEWAVAAARGDVAVKSQRVQLRWGWACEREYVSDRIFVTENLEQLTAYEMDCLFELIGRLCGAICENCGPALGALAEFMFKCLSVGFVPLIEFCCRCSNADRGCFLFHCFFNRSGARSQFDGCFYIALALILGAVVIGTLGMGIYALAQYVQDANPAVAASVACAILDKQLTGLTFSALPRTFGRSKGMEVVGSLSLNPVFVYNRCFNNNGGSAKFYVDDKLSAYTKLDKRLYSCHGDVTHQFEYGGNLNNLRVLNADKSLFVSTDNIPSTGSTTTFKDASNVVVATLAPSALGSGFDIRLQQSNSSAAAPLVLLAAAAFAQLTSSGNDECNGFVLAGGIIDLILLSIFVAYTAYTVAQWYKKQGQITRKFYEPDHIVEPEKYGKNDWAAEEYRQNRAAAAVSWSDQRQNAFPAQPPPVAAANNTAVMIQFDQAPNIMQPTAPYAMSAPPNLLGMMTPQPPAFNALPPAAHYPVQLPPAAHYPVQVASPSPPPAASYWEGADLRDKLGPVGYMKLKRYLTLHNVNCGNTLLKDELITLAIIHRGGIDFSPLISGV